MHRVVDLESGVGTFHVDGLKKAGIIDEMTHNLTRFISSKHTPKNSSAEHLRGLKKLQTELQQKDLLVMKADKGNQVIVMGKKEYLVKCMQQLDNSEVEEVFEGRSKILNKCLKNLKETLKDSSEVFGEGFHTYSNLDTQQPSTSTDVWFA